MYGGSASYRGSSLPAFSDASGDSGALFGRRRRNGTIEWERLVTYAAAALCVLMFVGILLQGNRNHLLSLEKEELEREVQGLKRETGALRASLNNQQQDQERTEGELHEAYNNIKRLETMQSRLQTFRESLQEELRNTQGRLRTCETDAKHREEELEADLAKVSQERNDLKIRVDTEHGMALEWSQKLASKQSELNACLSSVKSDTTSTPTTTTTTEGTKTEETPEKPQASPDVDLGRKAGALDDSPEEKSESATVQKEQKHRMELDAA